jgi:hypothetical protein
VPVSFPDLDARLITNDEARSDAPEDAVAPPFEVTPLLVPRDGNVAPIVDPVQLASWARRSCTR